MALLDFMAHGHKGGLIVVEGSQLPNATTVSSLDNLLNNASVTQMPKMHEFKAMAIKDMLVVMVMVVGRPLVRPMPWFPMSSRDI